MKYFCMIVIAAICLSGCLLFESETDDETGIADIQSLFKTDHYRSPNHDILASVDSGSDGLIFFQDYYDTNPAWSPDGSRIAFTSNRDGDNDIYIMDADGGNLRNLTLDPSPQLTSLLYIIDKSNDVWPARSPDGRLIAFSSGRDNIMMRSVDLNVYLMEEDGTRIRNLTYTGEDEGVPYWAPDGEKLVLAQAEGESINLFTINSDGSGARALTDREDDNSYPSWSPDSSQIAFESNRDCDYDIYLVDVDGSNLVHLTDLPGNEFRPKWSPAGDRIALACDRDDDMEIYIMDKDGMNLTQITSNDAYDSDPSWSPDGKHLVYQSNQTGMMRIFRVDIATKEVIQLTGGSVEEPPVENGVYYIHLGVAQLWLVITQDTGYIDTAIDTLTEAVRLEPDIAESYLARGLAYLFQCEYVWSHKIGTEIQILEREEDCPDLALALSDLEKAIELGLAPGLQPGVENLFSEIKK